MKQDFLKNFEEKGLPNPFIASKSGEVAITQSGESLKNEISQMATVIYETIGAIGDIKIDRIEMMGEAKGLIMELDETSIKGSLFEQNESVKLNDLWVLIRELKGEPVAVVEAREKPAKEKVKVKLESSVLDEMKTILKDYLGDFTERIYKNQLKGQRINIDEFYDDDARRLIFALGKAAGMIIGPSKGHILTNKLLELLK